MADIDRIVQIPDPAERAVEIGRVLNTLQDITGELRSLRQAAVRELQAKGWSYAKIGEALDLHRNRVQQIAEGRAGGGRGGGAKATAGDV